MFCAVRCKRRSPPQPKHAPQARLSKGHRPLPTPNALLVKVFGRRQRRFHHTPGWRRRKSGKVHMDELLGASAEFRCRFGAHACRSAAASIRRSTVLPGLLGRCSRRVNDVLTSHNRLAKSQGAGIPAARQFRGITRRNAMRTLGTLLATAALVAGVTIANAQSSGSPTQPAGPKAGGHDPNNTAGARITGPVPKRAAPALPPPGSSGSANQPAGAMAGGMKPSR